MLVGGISLYFAKTAGDLFTGISLFYFGLLILTFGSFTVQYVKNREKRRKSIFMHSQNVFPILEYNLTEHTMTTCNLEASLFFAWIFVVLIWGFTTTIFCDKEYRYIPISVMSVTLSVCYIYVISKNVSARSIDWKYFRQATFGLY